MISPNRASSNKSLGKPYHTVGETGDSSSAVSGLAACLHDDEPISGEQGQEVTTLQEAAERAIWQVFMRSSNPEVNELMQEGCRLMVTNRLEAARADHQAGTITCRGFVVFDALVQLMAFLSEAASARWTCQLVLRLRRGTTKGPQYST
jgi:hypothetical protein